jgi:hypothetical protein
MNPDPIIGRVLFADAIVRPVFRDDAGHQYVIDRDGHTRCYGTWLRPEDPEGRRAARRGRTRESAMKILRLTLSLAVCVPGCALLGAPDLTSPAARPAAQDAYRDRADTEERDREASPEGEDEVMSRGHSLSGPARGVPEPISRVVRARLSASNPARQDNRARERSLPACAASYGAAHGPSKGEGARRRL